MVVSPHRCVALADAHAAAHKYADASALYERALTHCRSAKAHYDQCDDDVSVCCVFLGVFFLLFRGNLGNTDTCSYTCVCFCVECIGRTAGIVALNTRTSTRHTSTRNIATISCMLVFVVFFPPFCAYLFSPSSSLYSFVRRYWRMLCSCQQLLLLLLVVVVLFGAIAL
jgi:hypothetical protein